MLKTFAKFPGKLVIKDYTIELTERNRLPGKFDKVYTNFTCTANSISHESSFTLALEITISVCASCIRVAVVNVLNTFIHICNEMRFNFSELMTKLSENKNINVLVVK